MLLSKKDIIEWKLTENIVFILQIKSSVPKTQDEN